MAARFLIGLPLIALLMAFVWYEPTGLAGLPIAVLLWVAASRGADT